MSMFIIIDIYGCKKSSFLYYILLKVFLSNGTIPSANFYFIKTFLIRFISLYGFMSLLVYGCKTGFLIILYYSIYH